MADNTLDRIDRTHGGDSRRYIAHLFVVGEATREQVADKLHEKYGVAVTTRIITTWKNGDKKLIGLMEELEAVKREVQPGDDLDGALAKMPAPINQALVDEDMFSFANEYPAFAKLMERAVEDEEKRSPAPPALDYYGRPLDDANPPADENDPADDPHWGDVFAVLAAEHQTPADFSADCERRLDGWEPPPPVPSPGAGALRGD